MRKTQNATGCLVLLILFLGALHGTSQSQDAKDKKGKELTAKDFVGTWIDDEKKPTVGLKISLWPKGAKEEGGTDGNGTLDEYDGKYDKAGKPMIATFGLVAWTKTRDGISFRSFGIDGRATDGTGVMVEGGKQLHLSFKNKKVLLNRINEPAKKQ